MRQNFNFNKRKREESKKLKREEKRLKRLAKKSEEILPDAAPQDPPEPV